MFLMSKLQVLSLTLKYYEDITHATCILLLLPCCQFYIIVFILSLSTVPVFSGDSCDPATLVFPMPSPFSRFWLSPCHLPLFVGFDTNKLVRSQPRSIQDQIRINLFNPFMQVGLARSNPYNVSLCRLRLDQARLVYIDISNVNGMCAYQSMDVIVAKLQCQVFDLISHKLYLTFRNRYTCQENSLIRVCLAKTL